MSFLICSSACLRSVTSIAVATHWRTSPASICGRRSPACCASIAAACCARAPTTQAAIRHGAELPCGAHRPSGIRLLRAELAQQEAEEIATLRLAVPPGGGADLSDHHRRQDAPAVAGPEAERVLQAAADDLVEPVGRCADVVVAGIQAPHAVGALVVGLRRARGHQKQDATSGHTKIEGKSLLVRGLNALAATISTPLSAPVIAATRLRGGNAASARGAASLAKEAIGTARAAGVSRMRKSRFIAVGVRDAKARARARKLI